MLGRADDSAAASPTLAEDDGESRGGESKRVETVADSGEPGAPPRRKPFPCAARGHMIFLNQTSLREVDEMMRGEAPTMCTTLGRQTTRFPGLLARGAGARDMIDAVLDMADPMMLVTASAGTYNEHRRAAVFAPELVVALPQMCVAADVVVRELGDGVVPEETRRGFHYVAAAMARRGVLSVGGRARPYSQLLLDVLERTDDSCVSFQALQGVRGLLKIAQEDVDLQDAILGMLESISTRFRARELQRRPQWQSTFFKDTPVELLAIGAMEEENLPRAIAALRSETIVFSLQRSFRVATRTVWRALGWRDEPEKEKVAGEGGGEDGGEGEGWGVESKDEEGRGGAKGGGEGGIRKRRLGGEE